VNETPFRHAFTVGIEEELLLVDPETHALRPAAADVLGHVGADRGRVDHELYASQLELRSGRCADAAEAVRSLRRTRDEVVRTGARLLGAGVHPTGGFGDAAVTDDDRYRSAARLFAGLMRRTPESALQVHIGMPSTDAAMRALNGFREYLPLLTGLAAASPFWFGEESGFASSRSALVRAYPTRGAPPQLSTYAEYQDAVDRLIGSAALPDFRSVYWDVRLNPEYGTVEVREMDAQADLRAVGALAALARGMAEAFVDGRMEVTPQDADVLAWSSFRAARDGIDAELSLAGRRRPLVEVLSEVLQVLNAPGGLAPADVEALDALRLLVDAGGNAGRQRATARRGGLRELVRELVEQTSGRP
jgi:carboxylate-amine ligase